MGNTFPSSFKYQALLIPSEDAYPDLTRQVATPSPRRAGQILRDQPAAHLKATLSKQKLESIDEEREKALYSPRGAYKEMENLAATMVMTTTEEAMSEAESNTPQGFDFVRDFALELPTPIKKQTTKPERQLRIARRRQSQWPKECGIKKAHDSGIDGQNVLIGVLDTGVDADHHEFERRTVDFRYVSFYPNSPYWPPRDIRGFDTDGHGTHVCGIANGRTIGVAPAAKLYCASVIESETTRTSMIRVADGLNWLLTMFSAGANANRPVIINMSLGFPEKAPATMDPADFQMRLRTIRRFVRQLLDQDVLTVAAIGNEGEDRHGYPGALDEVLAVGAASFDKVVANFSGNTPAGGTLPAKPDIVGYGVDVYSSIERDYSGNSLYTELQGTSMAAPYVAGIAALYRSAYPDDTAGNMVDRIKSNALDVGGPSHRRGAGLARYE